MSDFIYLETSAYSVAKPYDILYIESYISEIIKERNEFIDKYRLHRFEVKVLNPNKTFCEKIMNLIFQSYSDNPFESIKKKIRHIYDLHLLLEFPTITEFMYSKDFDKMIMEIIEIERIVHKNNNSWTYYPPKQALIFSEIDALRNKLSSYYNNEFKHLVYKDFPKWKDVCDSLATISKRIEVLDWRQ
jgi:hypothetical protein